MTTSIDALAGIAAIDAANEAEGGGADSGGWDFNQVSALTGSPTGSLNNVSVLNVSPTNQSTTQSSIISKSAKDLLYDPSKPATGSTHEDLYRGRRAAMKAAGVTYGTQAYKDWDAKTRALMGVGPKDKFSSGNWMSTFGGLNQEEINEEIGNVEYYLNDNLSGTSGLELGKSPHVPGYFDKFAGVSNIRNLSPLRPGGLPTVETVVNSPHFFGGHYIVPGQGTASINEVTPKEAKELGWEFVPGYFDKLQKEHPSFRVPSPHGGTNQPDSPVPPNPFLSPATPVRTLDPTELGDGRTAQQLSGFLNRDISPTTDFIANVSPQEEADFFAYGSPKAEEYNRRTTYAGKPSWETPAGQGAEMFGVEELVTALPGTYNEETAAAYNKDHPFIVDSYGNFHGWEQVKAGDPFINPITEMPSGNLGLTITGISGGDYKPGETLPQNFLPERVGGQYFGIGNDQNRKDLIKILAGEPEETLVHEMYHGANRVLAVNSSAWKDKVTVKIGKVNNSLFDILQNPYGGWDSVAMHIAVYAGSNNRLNKNHLDHTMFDDINSNTSLSDSQKYDMMLARGKAISHAMNKAAGLILESDFISQEAQPRNWPHDIGEQWYNPGG